MKILCLTPRLPYPPHRGDRLRAFHFIEHLSREHELTLLSFIAAEAEREYVAPLRQYCRDVRVVLMRRTESLISVASNLWRRQPLQALYYRSQAMHRLVDGVLAREPFDAAYVHLFRMAPYMTHHSELYRIVDLTDVVSREIGRSLAYRPPLSRVVYRIEQPRIERYERWVAEAFEEIWLISEADREILAIECPQANIHVVTNGINASQYHPTGEPTQRNSLIFVGHMGVFHNIDAARHLAQDILPLVQRQISTATLNIVGADPAPQVQRLQERSGVAVTGFVPDLNAALNRSAVFVAPLRFAAGVQNKVLEAMATARPVVTTSLVNEGLRARPGQELLIADDAPTTAERVVALLQDENLRKEVGRAGLHFVQQKYTWKNVVERMRAIERRIAPH